MKEYLTEELYTKEYDKIFLEKDFGGKLVDKLYYLLDKVRSLTFLRDTIINFLQKIESREVIIILIIFVENPGRNAFQRPKFGIRPLN
jgi:hypothetical protein